MGNKVSRRRQVVDERYTRPQGLYQHKDVDQKKLRKLILESKLAPCYPGGDDCSSDMEECPICFLFYPSLNRSKCCTKGICTECFLQMKPPHSSRPTQVRCPFCKTQNYAVEYRGKRTKEEKSMEQAEEQKVIEAKIRMRQQELQDDQERMLKRREMNSCSTRLMSDEVECTSMHNSSVTVPSASFLGQNEELVHPLSFSSTPSLVHPTHLMQDRVTGFNLDLEDIMLMEAIWLSIQESQPHRNVVLGDATLFGVPATNGFHLLPASSANESSSSAGLGCSVSSAGDCHQMNEHHSGPPVCIYEVTPDAMAALAEHPRMDERVRGPSVYRFDPTPNASLLLDGREMAYQPESWIEISPNGGAALLARQETAWIPNHGSEVMEVGRGFTGSDAMLEGGPPCLPTNDSMVSPFHPPIVPPVLPGNFEEQMMLAMTVPLAETRARPSPLGMAWL